MTLHYYGTPITPLRVLQELAGRCFCVSFARAEQVALVHRLGQSVLLDNGAFSLWRKGTPTDWPAYYAWADGWLDWPTTWAIVPDVIDGSAEENDALLAAWPFGGRGAPVWHLHEPIERLLRLADEWPRLCFGSSGAYAQLQTPQWHRRVSEAWNALAQRHRRLPWVHMLRGLAVCGGIYPFASADSSYLARSHAGNHTRGTPRKDPRRMADLTDAQQCPGRWEPRELASPGELFPINPPAPPPDPQPAETAGAAPRAAPRSSPEQPRRRAASRADPPRARADAPTPRSLRFEPSTPAG